MSYPTYLGPWHVVQRLTFNDDDAITGVEYYQASDEGDESWTTIKDRALLFMTINQAGRVADAETAEVRTLYSKEGAKEFGR
jgi:hypothetical protein